LSSTDDTSYPIRSQLESVKQINELSQ